MLLDLKRKAATTVDGTVTEFSADQSEAALRDQISQNKDAMEEVMGYLTKNQMELDAKIQGSDPL